MKIRLRERANLLTGKKNEAAVPDESFLRYFKEEEHFLFSTLKFENLVVLSSLLPHCLRTHASSLSPDPHSEKSSHTLNYF